MTNPSPGSLHKMMLQALKDVANKQGSCCRTCTFGHCCSEPVWCDRVEAQAMLDNLKNWPGVEPLKERVEKWFFMAKASGMLDLNMYSIPAEESKADFKKTYAYRWRNEVGMFCPLFNEVANRCTGYDDRPLACAMHFAKGEPAKCGTDERFTDKTQQVIDWGGEATEVLMSTLYNRYRPATGHVDHLGVHLYNILFGTHEESAMCRRFDISYNADGTISITKPEP